MERHELGRVGEIDRTELIDTLYVQRGSELIEQTGSDWNASAWDPAGRGEHSVAAQREALEREVDMGAVALGAFAGDRLVGIGVVLPHLRPGVAQLAFLYVDSSRRAAGIGGRLSDELERIAADAGDAEVVVSATPSENTVRFYRGRGYEPMAEPFAELFELEPEDIHMLKRL